MPFELYQASFSGALRVDGGFDGDGSVDAFVFTRTLYYDRAV